MGGLANSCVLFSKCVCQYPGLQEGCFRSRLIFWVGPDTQTASANVLSEKLSSSTIFPGRSLSSLPSVTLASKMLKYVCTPPPSPSGQSLNPGNRLTKPPSFYRIPPFKNPLSRRPPTPLSTGKACPVNTSCPLSTPPSPV